MIISFVQLFRKMEIVCIMMKYLLLFTFRFSIFDDIKILISLLQSQHLFDSDWIG